MNTLRLTVNKLFLVLLLTLVGNQAWATTAEQLNKDSLQALNDLYKTNPAAESLSKEAKAILVFPNIVKAGFVFGGSYGEGVLIKKSVIVDYYNSVSASWGVSVQRIHL